MAAQEKVSTARYCGLVTFDESGATRVRMMDPFLPDQDWSIWMGTDRDTRKVDDIKRDPNSWAPPSVEFRGGRPDEQPNSR